MKRKLLILLTIMMIVTASGCANTIELDEEQEAKFIGYSVYAVLEHDKNYMIGLNQVEKQTEENTELPDDNQIELPTDEGNISGGNSNGQSGSNTSQTVSMATALGLEGINVEYKDIKIVDSYPETDGTPAFIIKALAGHKLVVLKFDMTNTTASDIQVDISSRKLSFKGIFNEKVKTNSHVTLLPEAINTYDSTIKAGETVETVLVFEMSEGNAKDISDIVLEIKSESGTNIVKVK